MLDEHFRKRRAGMVRDCRATIKVRQQRQSG